MQLLLVKLGNELKNRDCYHAALPFSLCCDSPVLMFPLAIGLLGCQNSRHRTHGSSQVAKFILNGYFPRVLQVSILHFGRLCALTSISGLKGVHAT